MRAALLRWFAAEARPLPWRRREGAATDPPTAADRIVSEALLRDRAYAVWVMETMSQQTRIDTVVARLPLFLTRFPDVATLAAAEPDAVLAAWSGLGYYRRARALHAAARDVVEARGGAWPTTAAGWATLPGVGPYTAAAVVAQAFGVPGIALDGNVRRLGARLLAEPRPSEARLIAALGERFLTDLGDDPAAAGVAEALVELGARVCTPRAPRCTACPLRSGCGAVASGDPTRFPAPRLRAPPRTTELHAWISVHADPDGQPTLAFERRPDDGLWGGLYGPPWRPEPPPVGTRLGGFRHLLTHRRVQAVVWLSPSPPPDAEVRWIARTGSAEIGLAEIDRRALRLWAGARAADEAAASGPPAIARVG